MRKVVKLTEGDVRRIAQRIITERLGVPENIAETARLIYDGLMKEFSSEDLNSQSREYKILVMGDYQISDYKFNKIIVTIKTNETVDPDTPPQITSFNVTNTSKISGTVIQNIPGSNVIQISIVFAVGRFWTLSELVNVLKEKEEKVLSSISHELKHTYAHEKTPYESFKTNSQYSAAQDIHLGEIDPMNTFFHYLYFLHRTENLVRPSQLYSQMLSGKITKSQFKKFFEENETVATLQDAKNLTFDGLKDKLRNYLPQINDFFDYLEQNGYKKINRENGDEEIINTFLHIIYNSLINTRLEHFKSLLLRTFSPLDALFARLSGADNGMEDRQKMMNDYVKKAQKYKNYRDFFGNEIKIINFAADKMIRKLGKLYDMAPNDTNSSIVNWDLHHKINKTAEKTMQEISRLVREGKITISPPKEDDIKGKKPKL
jgi:hypothetical protein